MKCLIGCLIECCLYIYYIVRVYSSFMVCNTFTTSRSALGLLLLAIDLLLVMAMQWPGSRLCQVK